MTAAPPIARVHLQTSIHDPKLKAIVDQMNATLDLIDHDLLALLEDNPDPETDQQVAGR